MLNEWIIKKSDETFIKIYDVILDIHKELEISPEEIIIPIVPSIIKFSQLLPVDTPKTRDNYGDMRWKVLQFLKDNNIIVDFTLIEAEHRWNSVLQIKLTPTTFFEVYDQMQIEYQKRLNKTNSKVILREEDMKKIFVSHSSIDKPIIDLFIQQILRLGLSININDIFCTSTVGTDIKTGEDWRLIIQTNLQDVKIAILVITPNFKESEICQNELGAIWFTKIKRQPFIVEPINYSSVGALNNPLQLSKLSNSSDLDKFKDLIKELGFSSEEVQTAVWNQHRDKFLSELKNYLLKNPFQVPIDRKTFNETLNEIDSLRTKLKEQKQSYDDLDKAFNLLKIAKTKNEIEFAKDVQDVKNDDIPFFNKQVEELIKLLSNLHSDVQKVIYNSYADKKLKIPEAGTSEPIERAVAKGMLEVNEDGSPPFANKGNPTIIKVYSILDDLEQFLSVKYKDKDFSQYYKKKYGIDTFDCKIIDFWNDVLGLNI